MQNEIIAVGEEKASVGIIGRIIIGLLFLVLAVTIAHYKGLLSGIGSGIVFSWWFHRNIVRRRFMTESDVVDAQALAVQQKNFRPYAKYLVLFLLIVVIGDGILYLTMKEPVAIVVFDSIVSIVFLVFFYALRSRLGRQDTVAEAMSQAGFTFASGGDVSIIHNRIRSLGQDVSVGNIFSGNIEGFPARIFDFTYAWENKAGYAMTLLEITNERNCPNMLIISKSDGFGETISPKDIFPGVPIQLEGNFSDYFTVFVEAGAEDEIRQFLPPDLMAVLIDKMPDFSFLFFDNTMYIVISNNSDHGFLSDYFLEQVVKARFIVGKWAVTLSKIEA